MKQTNNIIFADVNTPVSDLKKVREHRKDLYLVAFNETSGLTQSEQYSHGLRSLKQGSANLLLAHDTESGLFQIIAPEETSYHHTKNRDEAFQNINEMANLRSNLTFTRSTVVPGQPVPWSSVYSNLKEVVDHCIEGNAYKSIDGMTAGHFAAKIDPTTFLTSRRKTNFNNLDEIGLVKVETQGNDRVFAYGSKPSVGGQSQRIIFQDHPVYDSIVHFHSPLKEGSEVPIVEQRPYECGSHECGQNTSDGLQMFGNLSAVYLDNHGPNIVFGRDASADEVINFIEENFDLSKKTGGYVQ